MNSGHLEFCASPQWREMVEQMILPEALRGVDLGTHVIEIGPGPGFTTEVLRKRAQRLTAVEVDPDLATSLSERMADSNVVVVCGDAAALEFRDSSFTGAASFHMLHHIATDETQDQVLAELGRVLNKGGALVAADGIANGDARAFHVDDTYNPIDPADLEGRLTRAGFESLDIRVYDLGWVCTGVAS